METISPIILILIVLCIWLPTRIKILKENERFVVTTLGRYIKIIGPGLLFKWQGSETAWTRISLGEVGRYLGNGTSEFQNIPIPVKFSNQPKQGVKIEKFADGEVWVEPSKIITVRCEKCGHYNEISA